MAREDNLRDLRDRTPEERKRIATMGGIASKKKQKEKKTMQETLKMILEQEYKTSGMTYREMATLGLIKGAVKGNPIAYKTIIETLGESALNETNGVLGELVEALSNVKDNK